jgi:hypothetical protein
MQKSNPSIPHTPPHITPAQLASVAGAYSAA